MEDKEISFEKKLEMIEKIAKDLQNPETELNEAVALFEKGMALASQVDKALGEMERRIEIVTSQAGDPDGVVMEAYEQDN